MAFKCFSIFSNGRHYVHLSGTILEILVKEHKRNISMKFILKPGHLHKSSCRFKIFLFLALAAILFTSTSPLVAKIGLNHFNYFGKGAQEEHFCEIILKSGHWLRKRCHFKIFLL